MSPISGDVVFSLILNNNTPVILNKRHCTLIENDLGDWSPVKDCCWRLTFRQLVRKPSSESSDRF